ncbi:chaperone modulator CbpM [Marinobacter sp.]|jgi:chaperone modulatory protein CbpM|uniref:chaperone modulator CbpM n=1 Tax=Marinobacter sp. TaxID=50741 RepID=UPI002E8270E5|nr:chaperone modulator CbpM [Oleiphilaceae bacterium]MEE2764421.1 chaperone modulator CbpM [Pseudomonadota bacterium]MEE3117941.1 chaperone modulator CbpM [Pseudomonadota bacterium]
MAGNKSVVTIDVAESRATFSLRELCERGECHAELVLKMVSYGIIEPIEQAPSAPEQNWEFDLEALLRLRKAMRLQRDLKINLPGLAVSLELLDQVDAMHRDILRLRQQLAQLSRGQGDE